MTANPQISEIQIMQYSAKGFDALLKDFLPMRYEQQTVFLPMVLFAKARIIKGGDNGFPAARCRNHQIPIMVKYLSLNIQLIQYFLLIGIRTDVKDKLSCFSLADILLISKRLNQPFLL